MKKIFLPIVLCVLMAISSLLLACTPIGEHEHNLVPVDEVAATCVKDGIRAHNICTICGYWFDDNGNRIDELDCVIEATGEHTYKDGKCTVCGTPDPNWTGGGGEDPDNPDNPNEPDKPVDQLAWLKGEWTQEGNFPWTVTFDGTTLKISYYRNEQLQNVTATSFKAEGDDKVTFVVPEGIQGEFSITKYDEVTIVLNFGFGNQERLAKQGVVIDPTAEYAIGMEEMVKAGFVLTKYSNSTGQYFNFISGKQIEIKYSYEDYAHSDDGQLVKIEGIYNINRATNAGMGSSTWSIYIDNISSAANQNRLTWSGPATYNGNFDWMGTNGKSDIAWINYTDADLIRVVSGEPFTMGGKKDFVFPEDAGGIDGIWDFTSADATGRVDKEIIVNVESNTVTYTTTTTYPPEANQNPNPKTESNTGSFNNIIEVQDHSGHTFYMLYYSVGRGAGWLRFNPYNGKLVEMKGDTGTEYNVFSQRDPNRAIPFAGALPADLKGEYTSAADGKYAFNGKYVEYTPASGEKVDYVVTDVKDGTSETTKKVTLAVASDKNDTVELTYSLADNTLTNNGGKVYKGENLYITPADNVPETLTGTYDYDGNISGWYYVFNAENNYKVTSREASGQTVAYYVTEYDDATKTLTLTQVTDLSTGHKVNDGNEALVVKMVYDETNKTLTIKGDDVNPDKVFKPSEFDREVILPEDLNGTYYIEGKTKYIDIIGYDVVLKGFAPVEKQVDGEYTISAFNITSGEMTLKAKDASMTEETVTLTLKDKAFTYGSETFVKGRPVKFTGDFYDLDGKYTIDGDELTYIDLDGKEWLYELSSENEKEAMEGGNYTGKYGWNVLFTSKAGFPYNYSKYTISMWYDYENDACKEYFYEELQYVREVTPSTVGVPKEVEGTYTYTYLKTYNGTEHYDIISRELVVDLKAGTIIVPTGLDGENSRAKAGKKRYFIIGYDERNKQLIAKMANEIRFGFDLENPNFIIDSTSASLTHVFSKTVDVASLPTALQTSGSFFCETETIDFDMDAKLVTITQAKTDKLDNSGKPEKADISRYHFMEYKDGVITLSSIYSVNVKTFYYEAEKDVIKLTKDDANIHASRSCDAPEGVEVLKGTFKSDSRKLIFDGTANVILKEGSVYKQNLVKSFDKDKGEITLFTGYADVVYTYDSATSTLTVGEDVYTLDKLPAGLDGTYRTSDGKQIVIYMGALVLTGSNGQDDTYSIAYEIQDNRPVIDRIYCTPDDSSKHDNFSLTIGNNGSLTSGNLGFNGTYVKVQE